MPGCGCDGCKPQVRIALPENTTWPMRWYDLCKPDELALAETYEWEWGGMHTGITFKQLVPT